MNRLEYPHGGTHMKHRRYTVLTLILAMLPHTAHAFYVSNPAVFVMMLLAIPSIAAVMVLLVSLFRYRCKRILSGVLITYVLGLVWFLISSTDSVSQILGNPMGMGNILLGTLLSFGCGMLWLHWLQRRWLQTRNHPQTASTNPTAPASTDTNTHTQLRNSALATATVLLLSTFCHWDNRYALMWLLLFPLLPTLITALMTCFKFHWRDSVMAVCVTYASCQALMLIGMATSPFYAVSQGSALISYALHTVYVVGSISLGLTLLLRSHRRKHTS